VSLCLRRYECVLAVRAYAYDFYKGSPDNLQQLSDRQRYIPSADSKYG
jgi:hypothetical protein